MPVKRQTIDNFKGIGSGQASGEFYYGENLKPGQFGLEASLYLTNLTATIDSRLTFITEFLNAPWGVDTAGNICKFTSNAWSEAHDNAQTSSGNGLLVDQLGRLLYKGARYLGKSEDGSSFTDDWKDLGSEITDISEMAAYEDWVIIPHGNVIKVMSVLDDTPADGLTLPDGFAARCCKANRNGLLIGANNENTGILVLWKPGYTRSLNEWIWLDSPILSIAKVADGWLVTTTQEQYLTDGYTLTHRLPELPDTQVSQQPFSCGVAGTIYTKGKILTFNTDLSGMHNRHKTGLWILDLATDLYTFVPLPQITDATTGGMYRTSTGRILASYTTTTPTTVASVAELREDIASRAVLIAGPFGDGPTHKSAFTAHLGLSTIAPYGNVQKSKSFKVSAKVYNFKRTLWGRGITNAESTANNELKVNGAAAGFNNAKVGDEVTILAGNDVGKVRHITAIESEDAGNEIWTLDAALSGPSAANIPFQVMPFEHIDTKTITFTALDDLEDQLFNIANKIQGRKFLLKFVLSDISSFPLTINHVSMDYDDKEALQ